MQIAALSVTDFRNYAAAQVQLAAGCTVFVGSNGQGKTNLVEAIAYAATLGSHRVGTDAPLIREGATTALIQVTVRRGDRQAVLDLALHLGRANQARLNGANLPRIRDCLGLVSVVVFAPEDLVLVKGDPSARRAFLDQLLVQRQPRLAGVIADLDRVLKQRAALLKSVAKRGGRPDDTDQHTLSVWDSALADLGGQIWWARLGLLAALQEPFQSAYRDLAGHEADLSMSYRSSTQPELEQTAPLGLAQAQQLLASALPVRSPEEFRRGVNLTGPHRDDVLLSLNNLPAKGYASHGESWSLALALRLASYRLLAAESTDHGDPVLILDDVFAELDQGRRTRLAQAVRAAEQVLITAAVESDVPDVLLGHRYQVVAGQIMEEL